MAKMLERHLEAKVVSYVKSRKCLVYKFSSPSHRGVSDRIIITPNGIVLFLELKAEGQKPTALQLKFLNEVTAQGGIAAWFDNFKAIRDWIDRFIDTPKSDSRPYDIWDSMHQRCSNPNNISFKYYGAKGITVCNRWSSFASFWYDMRGTYAEDLTLDRIDSTKGYYKENCRWATRKEQQRNRTNTVYVETLLGVMPMSEAAEIAGVTLHAMALRVAAKWSMEKLLLPNTR